MPPKSRRTRGKKVRKTRRVKRLGGAEAPSNELLVKIIAATQASPVIVNPASKFVVVTYWWGGDNRNRNTQDPCPEEVGDMVKQDMINAQAARDESFRVLQEAFVAAKKARDDARASGSQATPEQNEALKKAQKERNAKFKEQFLSPEGQDEYKRTMTLDPATRMNSKEKELKEKKDFCDPTTFREMIKHWESACRRNNCNYMAVYQPEFEMPGGYQMAINAKPLFIKKALDLCGGRGCLYIDGDMFVNKQPRVFDIPNVDYMARNWNCDPRSNEKYLNGDICFDPYQFETSGGTMFFADSPMSRRLLDDWWTETALPKSQGKAEDRIISLIYTQKNYLFQSTQIQLPIEYLWLTDLQDFQEPDDAAVGDSILEHPECLTGEERAAELSFSTVDRTPEGQNDVFNDDNLYCSRGGGFFQEYIFFPTKDDVTSMSKQLNQLANATNAEGDNPLQVVPQDKKYGQGNFDYNPVAAENEAALANETVAESAGQTAQLPQDATPAQILARLKKGVHVSVGGGTELPNTEFVIQLKNNQFNGPTPRIEVDVSKPMFIHSGNPIIHHLLMMCKTLEDMNTHLKDSFVFASRIRWSTPEGLFAVNGPTGLQRQTMRRTPETAPGTEPAPVAESAPTPGDEDGIGNISTGTNISAP